ALPEPDAEEHGRSLAKLPHGARPRIERRPTSPAATRPVFGRRDRPEQGTGPAVFGQRDRRQDHRVGEDLISYRTRATRSWICPTVRFISRDLWLPHRRFRLLPPRTSPATKKCAGARAAATIRSWRR